MIRSILILLAAFAIVALVSFTGNVATTPKLAGWYAQLAKPSFTPPNYIFPIAWTTLYALMAVSLWRLLMAQVSAARTRALTFFAAQLVVNAAWPWVFFHFEMLKTGVAVIALLAALVAATIWAARPVSAVAAWLLAPYLGWVLFATLLNFEFARMNG